ncbi:hypothetical protein WA158_006000 [Blastocystis sp. Blastoise]
MFKRDSDIDISTKTLLRKKEIKTFRSKLSLSLRGYDENADKTLFASSKSTLEEVKLRNKVNLYILEDGLPYFIQTSDERIYPTIFALWKVPYLVLNVVVYPEVSKVIIRGADLMAPGVLTPYVVEDRYLPILQKTPCSISIYGNPVPFAVGYCCTNSFIENINNKSGKIITVQQVYGDCLWKQFKGIHPNEGFQLTSVQPLESEMKRLMELARLSMAENEQENTEENSEVSAEIMTENNSVENKGDVTNIESCDTIHNEEDNKNILSNPDENTIPDKHVNENQSVVIDNYNEIDLGDALFSDEDDIEGNNDNNSDNNDNDNNNNDNNNNDDNNNDNNNNDDNNNEESDKEEEQSIDPKVLQEHFDGILFQEFVAGINELTIEDIPIQSSSFYSKYINVNIKETSYKKQSKFFSKMAKEGYIKVKEGSQQVITNINFEDPIFVEYKQTHIQKPIKTQSKETQKDTNADVSIEIETRYKIPKSLYSLFNSMDHNSDELYTMQEAKSVLSDYLVKNNLILETDKSKVRLSASLIQSLYFGTPTAPSIYPENTTRKELAIQLETRLIPYRAVKTAGNNVAIMKKGKIVPIEFFYGKIKGIRKSVTRVFNLKEYDIDINVFAKAIAKKGAASSSIQEGPNNEVIVQIQGDVIQEAKELLVKQFGVPSHLFSMKKK